ncbi:MAG: hypothetical protein LBI05_09455 [Planctomycetaceae bacterium]|jgi:hypothetical protein|nr:hypothetical protein [Planctomycetaceae bacterium]
MTVATDEEYANEVFEIASQARCEFSPFALPNEDGDCVEFFVSPNDFYAKRIDDYLTLYIEEGTDEVAGFVVKNISRILERVATQQAAYSFVIQDGEVRLEALFTSMFLNDGWQITHVREYRTVVDIAQSHQLDKVQISSILERVRTVANTSGGSHAPV